MKVLVANQWDPEGLELVKEAHPEVEWLDGLTPESRAANVAEADVIYGWIDRETFRNAKNVRWVQSHSAGVDWAAKIPELVDSDVILTNTSGAHAQTIAEHTIGMLIFLARGFGPLFEAQRNREWMRPLNFRPVGLAGLTMGIIGLGNIGKAIGRIAHGIGMPIIAVDKHDVERPDYVIDFWNLDGLPELLKRADVVVTAVPYTRESIGMIGEKEIGMMRPNSYLLAISRGAIVSEEPLIKALKSGHLAGAGLDVQEEEPMSPDNPLWDAPNLILTPHCSGTSQRTTSGVTEIFRRNLELYLAGEELTNVCDKELGY